ncbi:MAG: serine/threonine protein kinase [Oscillochloridaceae bacterium umkhey_bin13]
MTHHGQTIRLTATPADPPDCGVRPGMCLGGRFVVAQPLGYGGQAVVFAATDRRSANAPVALKVARRDLEPLARNEAEASLRWEASLLRRLRHPALPRLYHSEASSRSTWLARELIPGQQLNDVATVQRGKQGQIIGWLLQICDVLSYLHSREVPVVVGDLKPRNLIVRQTDAQLLLIDLGAALTMTRRPPRLPRPRHGTPGYAPPEQLAGREYDERADIFALGVLGYERCTGLDPTLAPLQFDLGLLDRVAPALAPLLRTALAPDPEQRWPTAAVFRDQLLRVRDQRNGPAPGVPLRLHNGVALNNERDFDAAVRYHPQALVATWLDGTLEAWLVQHPEVELGQLRYRLRRARKTAPPKQAPLTTLLAARAPNDGSPHLVVQPTRLWFGAIPLQRWRIWSAPLQLRLHNPTPHPLQWELTGTEQRQAKVRVLVHGKLHKQLTGLIAPGEQRELSLVAMGKAGPHAGTLQLRCGNHAWMIPWEAQGVAGVPVGGQHVARLHDLDLSDPKLLPALDALLLNGVLVRWLKLSGQPKLAAQVAAELPNCRDQLARQLLLGHILSHLDPMRFPHIRLRGLATAGQHPLLAGEASYTLIEVDNLGTQPCTLHWRSTTPWATVASAPQIVSPGASSHIAIRMHPPRTLRGPQPVSLWLEAGALRLAVVLAMRVEPPGLLRRVLQFLQG